MYFREYFCSFSSKSYYILGVSHLNVLSSVPQGTVLGPLLFLVYINDITDQVSPGTLCRLFADDCLLYRPIHSLEDQLILQRDVDALQRWTELWGMRFNPKKCYIMHKNCRTRQSSINGHLSGLINAGIYPGVSREICSIEHQILPSIGPSWQSVGTSDTSHHGIVMEADDFSYSSLRAETPPPMINSPPLLRTSLILVRRQLQFPGERSKRYPVQHPNHRCQQGRRRRPHWRPEAPSHLGER